MTTTIENIQDNARVEYTGDVHITGSIGKNAVIIVNDGNLTVDGNVGDKATITLVQHPEIVHLGFNNTAYKYHNCFDLVITGDIGEQVNIRAKSASFTFRGKIGTRSQIKTYNGYISTADIMEGTKLRTYHGNIATGNIAANVTLKTYNGGISALEVGDKASITTYNGIIEVRQAAASATIRTINGDVYENGVKRPRPRRQGINNVYVGNNRIFVNGREITNSANGANNSDSKTKIIASSSFIGAMILGLAVTIPLIIFMPVTIVPLLLIIGAAVAVGAVIGGAIGCKAASSCITAEVTDSTTIDIDVSGGTTTNLRRSFSTSGKAVIQRKESLPSISLGDHDNNDVKEDLTTPLVTDHVTTEDKGPRDPDNDRSRSPGLG